MSDENYNGPYVNDTSNSGAIQENSSLQSGSFGNDNSSRDNSVDVALENIGNANGSDNSKSWSNQQSFAMDESIDVRLDNVGNEDNSDTNSHNDNSDRSTDVDVALADSFNDNSDRSTDVDVRVEDAFKDQSMTDSGNDNSNNADINSHNDNSHTVEVGIEDAFKDESITDSFNDNSSRTDTTTETTVDVAISDAFKSYSDAFNDDSESFGQISVNFENVFNGAFGGDGSGHGFAINQVADIVDNDRLENASQDNSGSFEMSADGGEAHQKAWDDVDDPFGGDGSDVSIADASAVLQGSAFNLDIVMGSNLQQNAVDISIVGGSADNNDTTTNNGDSF